MKPTEYVNYDGLGLADLAHQPAGHLAGALVERVERADDTDDRTEQRDLSAEHPDEAEALKQRWVAWADSHRVRPYPGKRKPTAKK